MDARWAWACDDPRSLERSGLEVRESATITRPPRAMRAQLPFRYRYLLPLADPVLGKAMAITLFRASSPAAAGWMPRRGRPGRAEPCRGGCGMAEPVPAPGPHRLAEFHGGEAGRPVGRAVPGAEIAVMQLDLDQPPGQQLGGGAGRRVQHPHRDLQPSSGSCLATVRSAIAESARSAVSSLARLPASCSMPASLASALA